jgi:hypothetical protein
LSWLLKIWNHRTKRVFEALAMIVLVVGSIEAGAQFFYRYQYGARYSRQTAADPYSAGTAFQKAKHLSPLEPEISTQVVHPYLGFVATAGVLDQAVRTFGFTWNKNPLPFTSVPGQVNILVTGGSVAGGLTQYLEAAYYRDVPDTGSRPKPYFFGVSLGGYKQPQQALALMFLLSVGVKFDIVINIDGYNEVALPYFENYRAHSYPFFPRAWRNRIADRGVGSKLLGEIIYLDNRKENLTEAMKHHSIYYSATAGLYALWQLNQIMLRINELAELANAASIDLASFEQSGPYVPGLSSDDVTAQSMDVWSRSSLMMQSIAKGAGIEYFHVLQPNQYVENSKPFTDQEKALAIVSSPLSLLVIKGYRLLIARGKTLGLANYLDATGMFIDEKRTIYADNCCHFNKLGNEILADAIMREVAARSLLLHR